MGGQLEGLGGQRDNLEASWAWKASLRDGSNQEVLGGQPESLGGQPEVLDSRGKPKGLEADMEMEKRRLRISLGGTIGHRPFWGCCLITPSNRNLKYLKGTGYR